MRVIQLLCRPTVYLIIIPLFSVVILTITTTYFYRNYLLHRQKNLHALINSLESFPLVNITHHRTFESTILPSHLIKFIQHYLSNPVDHYLIVDCETGLGNRMQTIISAFLMALLTNRRLLIHWSATRLSACQYNQLFEPVVSMSSTLLNFYTKEYIRINSDYLTFHGPFDELLCHSNLTLYKQKTKFLFLSTDEYFMSVLMKNPAYSQTLFLDVNEDSLFKSLANYLFVPMKELSDKIQFHSNNHTYCDKGIHMRKKGLKQIKANGEKLFLDCILNETTSKNETWFVASDYNPYKTYIKSYSPSNDTKVWSLDSLEDTSQCSNVQQALIELWLLSKCQRLFLTHWSSFSWLASGMSGTYPMIVSENSCHIQPFSRPCYYELTHIKQLSCYDYNEMLRNDGCCQSEKFCHSDCLHHQNKYGSHSFYFLLIWPMFPLMKWMFKWIIVLFLLIFLLNRIRLRWNFVTLLRVYKKMIIVILLLCIVYIDIRCLLWSLLKII